MVEQEPVAGNGVVDGYRKGMLGCQAVVQAQHAGLRGTWMRPIMSRWVFNDPMM